jgi:hypothetical protein
MSWASRAAANLLPLSYERRDLAVALKEWRYTGNYHDLEVASENCELCNHPDIRYQFEIEISIPQSHYLLALNAFTASALLQLTKRGGHLMLLARGKRSIARSENL